VDIKTINCKKVIRLLTNNEQKHITHLLSMKHNHIPHKHT